MYCWDCLIAPHSTFCLLLDIFNITSFWFGGKMWPGHVDEIYPAGFLASISHLMHGFSSLVCMCLCVSPSFYFCLFQSDRSLSSRHGFTSFSTVFVSHCICLPVVVAASCASWHCHHRKWSGCSPDQLHLLHGWWSR